MALDTWMILGVWYLLIGYGFSHLIHWVWYNRSESRYLSWVVLPVYRITGGSIMPIQAIHDYNGELPKWACRMVNMITWPFLFVEGAFAMVFGLLVLVKGGAQWLFCTCVYGVTDTVHKLTRKLAKRSAIKS